MRPLLLSFLLLQLAPCLAFAQDYERHAKCSELRSGDTVPPFNIPRQYHSGGDPRILNLYLSLQTKSFGEVDLVSLSCKLRSEFAKDAILHVWLFDDEKSAKNLAIRFEDQDHYIEYLSHLKAYYELDRTSGSEFLEFLFPRLQGELPKFDRIKMFLNESAGRK